MQQNGLGLRVSPDRGFRGRACRGGGISGGAFPGGHFWEGHFWEGHFWGGISGGGEVVIKTELFQSPRDWGMSTDYILVQFGVSRMVSIRRPPPPREVSDLGASEANIQAILSGQITRGMTFGAARPGDVAQLVKRVLFLQGAQVVTLKISRWPHDEAGRIGITVLEVTQPQQGQLRTDPPTERNGDQAS